MRRVSSKKTQATHMSKSVITISDDGSLVRKRMFSGLFTSHKLDLAEDRRGNIVEIPVDDAMVVQVLHARQARTGDKIKRISLSLLSPAEEQSNVPKHCYGILFQEMAALTEVLKGRPANSELESKVVFCPRLEPFVEFGLQKDNQTG